MLSQSYLRWLLKHYISNACWIRQLHAFNESWWVRERVCGGGGERRIIRQWNGNIKCFSQWVWGQRSQSAYRHISHLVMINYHCVAMATRTLIAFIQLEKKNRALMKRGRETNAAVWCQFCSWIRLKMNQEFFNNDFISEAHTRPSYPEAL